ncbi:uncharacterized protein METZ01_LOCUS191226 [marine metagenome]|uniref:mannan endo-1,4-beta-mannosidase n=1 Tax=marine metagenome TaxID=408172 RepID=A0A382DK26_9ZZZZ
MMIWSNIYRVGTIVFLLSGYASGQVANEFVRVNGKQFEINGMPYYFVGANLWYGAHLAVTDPERLINELDYLQELGISNLRILGAAEGAGEFRIRNSIQPEPGIINDEILAGLDFLLSEMAKRDMKAVVYLNNYWVWSGGMAQYVSWDTGEPYPNPHTETYHWSEFMDFSARFYSLPQAIEMSHNYIRQFIPRRNSITGILYRDDPTIMAWQLANEPRPGRRSPGYADVKGFHDWSGSTAALIKSLDPNHLVSTGSEGTIGCLDSDDCYTDAHGVDVDYLTMHVWIKNWNWFDPQRPEETLPAAKEKVRAYLARHVAIADSLDKPLVVEEFGCPRDKESYVPDSPVSIRDDYFKFLFDLIYENASNRGPLAGSNFWAWGGYGKPDQDRTYWGPGDDATGDPPQEPQGLYSIFASDATTLEIIQRQGQAMRAVKP